MFLELVMITILVVIWVIILRSLEEVSRNKSRVCQRLAVIEKSYLVLQPVAVLLMGVMGLLRHIQRKGESKSLQENDQE